MKHKRYFTGPEQSCLAKEGPGPRATSQLCCFIIELYYSWAVCTEQSFLLPRTPNWRLLLVLNWCHHHYWHRMSNQDAPGAAGRATALRVRVTPANAPFSFIFLFRTLQLRLNLRTVVHRAHFCQDCRHFNKSSCQGTETFCVLPWQSPFSFSQTGCPTGVLT